MYSRGDGPNAAAKAGATRSPSRRIQQKYFAIGRSKGL